MRKSNYTGEGSCLPNTIQMLKGFVRVIHMKHIQKHHGTEKNLSCIVEGNQNCFEFIVKGDCKSGNITSLAQ